MAQDHNDIYSIVERLAILEGRITPSNIKHGLNTQQKSVPQMPALFKPKTQKILGGNPNAKNPMSGYAVGGCEESEEFDDDDEVNSKIDPFRDCTTIASEGVANEDVLDKVKKTLSDYLDTLKDEIKTDSDIKDKKKEDSDLRAKDKTDRDLRPKQVTAEGLEQQYLWHGSRQKIPMLEPRQSVDTGGAAGSNQNAIYATSDPKVAIAMGLTTPGSDTGMFPNDPQMVLFSGKIRKGENVYLHKVPMNGPDGKPQFVQGGNSREWYSKPGVKGIKPTEIKAVPVDKYLNLIRQATPQDLELRKKYMKQGIAEAIDTQAYYIVNANKNYSILAGPFASREQGRAEFQKIIHQYPGDLKDLSLLQGHVLQQSQKDALDEPDSKEPWHGIKDPELLKDLIADAQVMDYDEFYDEYSSMFDDPEEFWDNYHNDEQDVVESAPIKTVTNECGLWEVHGDEHSGFEIRHGNRQLPTRFRNLEEAELALEMFNLRRRRHDDAADYIDEA